MNPFRILGFIFYSNNQVVRGAFYHSDIKDKGVGGNTNEGGNLWDIKILVA